MNRDVFNLILNKLFKSRILEKDEWPKYKNKDVNLLDMQDFPDSESYWKYKNNESEDILSNNKNLQNKLYSLLKINKQIYDDINNNELFWLRMIINEHPYKSKIYDIIKEKSSIYGVKNSEIYCFFRNKEIDDIIKIYNGDDDIDDDIIFFRNVFELSILASLNIDTKYIHVNYNDKFLIDQLINYNSIKLMLKIYNIKNIFHIDYKGLFYITESMGYEYLKTIGTKRGTYLDTYYLSDLEEKNINKYFEIAINIFDVINQYSKMKILLILKDENISIEDYNIFLYNFLYFIIKYNNHINYVESIIKKIIKFSVEDFNKYSNPIDLQYRLTIKNKDDNNDNNDNNDEDADYGYIDDEKVEFENRKNSSSIDNIYMPLRTKKQDEQYHFNNLIIDSLSADKKELISILGKTLPKEMEAVKIELIEKINSAMEFL
jgi:hypothetical protein